MEKFNFWFVSKKFFATVIAQLAITRPPAKNNYYN